MSGTRAARVCIPSSGMPTAAVTGCASREGPIAWNGAGTRPCAGTATCTPFAASSRACWHAPPTGTRWLQRRERSSSSGQPAFRPSICRDPDSDLDPGQIRHRALHRLARILEVFQLAGEVLIRSEEHTSELQSLRHLVCRLLLE